MKRIPELDALRGLAAVFIAVFHMHGGHFLGWSRVELFLVLSGFLITSVVLRNQSRPGFLPSLYIRRALRIWPSYFLALGLMVVLNPLFNQPFSLDGLPYYLCFLQNLPRYWGEMPPEFPLYFRHTWTLAVIEQFHLLWPLVLLFLGPRRAILAGLALILISACGRPVGLHPWVLAGRADALALGSLLAIAFSDPQRVQLHRPRYLATLSGLIAVGLTLIALSPGGPAALPGAESVIPCKPIRLFACALIYTGLVGLVALSSGHRLLAPLRHPWLLALGGISYGIYLFHPLTIVLSGRILREAGFNWPAWLLEPFQIACCLFVATAVYWGVERPIHTLRDRWAARRDTASSRPAQVAVHPT